MTKSLHHRLDRIERIERRGRESPGVRYVVMDGSSEEEGQWHGNYFLRRTPMTVEEWEQSFVTPT
jgi:hypothetical protein